MSTEFFEVREDDNSLSGEQRLFLAILAQLAHDLSVKVETMKFQYERTGFVANSVNRDMRRIYNEAMHEWCETICMLADYDRDSFVSQINRMVGEVSNYPVIPDNQHQRLSIAN